MYLLDTNVISELRKYPGKADVNVVAWFGSIDPALLFLSSITLMELAIGYRRLAGRDGRQSELLRIWLHDHVLTSFVDRIISIDANVALRCAQLHVPNPRAERDAWIAATALVHGMTVVTRNVSDFAPTGVKLLNPWDAQTQ